MINIKIFSELENQFQTQKINYNELKQKITRFIEALAKGIHSVNFYMRKL